MGTKRSDMHSNFQTGLHNFNNNKHRQREYDSKHSWDGVHSYRWYNNIKMADALKWMANSLGLSIFILGILANLGNIISVTLGVIGIAVAFVKCLKLYEDYLIRKIERKERERDFKNKI